METLLCAELSFWTGLDWTEYLDGTQFTSVCFVRIECDPVAYKRPSQAHANPHHDLNPRLQPTPRLLRKTITHTMTTKQDNNHTMNHGYNPHQCSPCSPLACPRPISTLQKTPVSSAGRVCYHPHAAHAHAQPNPPQARSLAPNA
jgi:hypothetical protein